MYGIKELREMMTFFGQFATVTGEVTADGKVSLVELFKFATLWPVIAPAIDGYKAAIPELKDLDTFERAELVAEFSKALKLPEQTTETVFEEGADLALHIVQFIGKVRELRTAAAEAVA